MGRRVRALILVAALLAAGVFAGSALSQWWALPGGDAAAATAHVAFAPHERVRVEVLNAAGRANLAKSATDVLRDGGFDVVYFGNADSFGSDPTVVIDRVGRIDLARSVADALGVRAVRSEPDTNLFVDVSVRLGEEWGPPPPSRAVSRPDPAWWDLRRFLRRERAPQAPGSGGTMADPARDGTGRADPGREGTGRDEPGRND